MKTIAWDIDDVLNELMLLWFERKWKIEHSECDLNYSAITENPPHKILGVSKEEYLTSLDEFRLSIHYRKMRPIAEVKNWFLKYGKLFRHIAITATPLRSAYISANWTLRHFGSWIRTFHFVPSIRKGVGMPKYDISKKDFLRWFGKVDIFIDDNERNIQDSAILGIKGILFPRPWNKSKLTVSQTLAMIR